ncbi:hypothetical protein [Pararobbsia alpina]|uniref:Uncharacterized protein n=1 Tax=Pararobbsia alpina TaxID=621374 RepID=A0A6S7AV72_9BURK|nr:hypothetical protein [Pararobbsia alpina]CAB3778870.1 hypothetical protein LMG28138_00669 [Pararobbsia alpina]
MNTLKTAASRFTRLAPKGQMRWLKLAVYGLVFLLPFGMAILALLVYFDRRHRAAAVLAPAPAALPAPCAVKGTPIVVKSAQIVPSTSLSTYCSNPH